MFYPIYIFDPASYIFGLVLVMVVLLFIYADEGNINNILFRDVLSQTTVSSLCTSVVLRWLCYHNLAHIINISSLQANAY